MVSHRYECWVFTFWSCFRSLFHSLLCLSQRWFVCRCAFRLTAPFVANDSAKIWRGKTRRQNIHHSWARLSTRFLTHNRFISHSSGQSLHFFFWCVWDTDTLCVHAYRRKPNVTHFFEFMTASIILHFQTILKWWFFSFSIGIVFFLLRHIFPTDMRARKYKWLVHCWWISQPTHIREVLYSQWNAAMKWKWY